MLKKPDACRGCILDYDWNGFSIPEGTGKNKVLIIGESLGEKEKYHGTPFVRYAEAGSTLELAFRMAKVKREDFGLWNLIGCQPPNNKLDNTTYEHDAISHCQVHFNRVLNKFKPSVFLALGAVPFKYITGTNGNIGGILINRGYLFDSIYKGIKVVPSLHPSFINRKLRKHIGVLVRDIRFALDVATGKKFNLDTKHYTEEPTESDILDFIIYAKSNPDLPITYDIETSYSKLEAEDIESNQDVREITQIQFQIGMYKAIVLDWPFYTDYDNNFQPFETKRNNYIDYIKEILQLPNPKAGWNNWLFDSINLEYHLGKGIVKGTNYDLMWAWHHYQPDVKWPGMKLQFVTNIYESAFPAWKHLASDKPYLYGCYDVDSVARIYPKLLKDLKNPFFKHKNLHSIDLTSESTTKKTGVISKNVKTLFEGYTDDVVKLWPILQKMSDRGIPIDLKARQEFREEIKKQIEVTDNLIQKLYPFDLRKTEHKEGYKYVPKDVFIYKEIFRKRMVLDSIKSNGFNASSILDSTNSFCLVLEDDKIDSLEEEFIEQNTRKEGMSGLIVRPFRINGAIEYRYDRIETFKPNSSQQLLKYIKAKGHKTGKKKTKEGEWRDTTDKEHIFKLWQDTGDPLYENIILVRELKKMLSTYIGDNDINLYENIETNEATNEVVNPEDSKQLGWPIGRDSRVHSTFIPEPATGQLSSTRPNVQNTPSKGNQFSSKGYRELARKFRRIIKASEGKTLMECVDPKTRILTSNLEWVEADTLRLGDELLAFDKHPDNVQRRRLRKSIVEGLMILPLPKVEIVTDMGSVICSTKHLWLARKGSAGAKLKWIKAKDLRIGDKISYFTKPWEVDNTYDGGYISGFLDGEGYLTSSNVMFGQNEGNTLDNICNKLLSKGFDLRNDNPKSTKLCKQMGITGYPFTGFRVCGMFRPNRLLYKLKNRMEGTAVWGRNTKAATIISIKDLGVGRVVSISTSTQTYIAEGFLSHNCDYSGFHALMLGFEAEDETYMRLARLGIHDYIAAYIVKANLPKQLKQLSQFLKNNKGHSRYNEAEELYGNLNRSHNFLADLDGWITLPDNELKVKLKYVKKNHEFERNAQAKPAAHGIGFGEGVNKLYNLNRHSFANKKQVQDLHDLIKSLFPKVFEYQDKIRLLAHHQHYLVSRFGYIRWFHDVFDWRLIPEGRNPKPNEVIIKGSDNKWWLRTAGKDSEACIAYYPSNNAFGKMKEAMRECEELGYLDKYGLINQIHDSLMFEIWLELIKEAAKNVYEVMIKPSKHLINSVAPDGLWCGVEIKIGESWDSMIDYDLSQIV
jgi:uracil-DNA glycosylase family 4